MTLAITTAGPVATALIIEGKEEAQATTAQALDGTLKCVLAVLEAAHLTLDAVTLIAVCRGPGSFTGLRIGVALAKSISQARELPIVGVSSYDVADFGLAADQFPRVALIEGKRGYFYARTRDAADALPRYARGTRDELAGSVSDAGRRFLADVPATEQAARVARVGRLSAERGEAAHWRNVDIDYGQQPNAVINWEARGARPERGGAPSAANLKQR